MNHSFKNLTTTIALLEGPVNCVSLLKGGAKPFLHAAVVAYGHVFRASFFLLGVYAEKA
jgi:hypothetical protein